MYEDVAASKVGAGMISGAVGAGALGNSGILPITGIALLQILGVGLMIMGLGVALLRVGKTRRISSLSE